MLRPRSTGCGTTAKRDATVTDDGPSPRCTPFISCNPPVTRADLLVIHAGVVVRLPCPTGGRAATGRVATIAGGLTSCRAPIDGCCYCCSSLGACTVPPAPMVIHAGMVVRRPRPTDGETAAPCVATGRAPSCCSQSNSCCCRVPAARARIVVRHPRPIDGVTTAECAIAVGCNWTPSCCSPVSSSCCSPPGERAGLLPLPIHAGVIVLLPRPIGGEFAAGCSVAVMAALCPPCWVPINGCCCRPSGPRVRTHADVDTG